MVMYDCWPSKGENKRCSVAVPILYTHIWTSPFCVVSIFKFFVIGNPIQSIFLLVCMESSGRIFFSPLSSGLLKACDNYLCMAYILVYFAAIVSHYLSSSSIEPATLAASRWVQFLLKNSLPHLHFKVVALGTTTLYDMPSSPHHFLVPRCKK